MNRFALLAGIAAVTTMPAAVAQKGVEHWKATSTTAQITGPIALSPTRLTAAGKTVPLAVAADVKAFKTDHGTFPARILRVAKPSDPVLLQGNHFCQGPVRWFVVWREQPASLGMAAFNGAGRPASEDDKGLCATFLYSR